jgi:hypothetical protein
MGPQEMVRRLFGSALAMAVIVGLCLEYAVFRHGYLLADRSTLTIVYKGARLEQGRGERAIVLGPSTALAIDARRLEQASGGRVAVYNYALPNLGGPEQYYFVLKKYLRYNARPERIILGLPPDSIMNETAEQADPFIEEIEKQRFRRFFGPVFLVTDVARETGRWSFVGAAAATVLPSINYRVFIKSGTFAPEQDEISDWEPADSVQALYHRNRDILADLDATNGQLLYYAERVVAASSIARTIPTAPNRRASGPRWIEKAIGLAESSGVGLTLIFTPMCCERATAMEQTGTWRMLSDLMDRYRARYPHFRFVDVGNRSYDREYFGDAVHLNARGADRFNKELNARATELLSSSTESN